MPENPSERKTPLTLSFRFSSQPATQAQIEAVLKGQDIPEIEVPDHTDIPGRRPATSQQIRTFLSQIR